MEDAPKAKKEKTEKQMQAWQKCQQARAKNLKKKKEEKSHRSDEKFVINEVNEVIGGDDPMNNKAIDLVQEKLNEIRKKKEEHIARISRIWEDIRQEKMNQVC